MVQGAAGMQIYAPAFLRAARELCDRLAFMLGGRAAEKLIYDQYSAGAENDLDPDRLIFLRRDEHVPDDRRSKAGGHDPKIVNALGQSGQDGLPVHVGLSRGALDDQDRKVE